MSRRAAAYWVPRSSRGTTAECMARFRFRDFALGNSLRFIGSLLSSGQAFPAPSLDQGRHDAENPARRAAVRQMHGLTHSLRQRAILQPQACASSACGAARDLRVHAMGEFNRPIAESDRRALARASGCRLHQRWALPFAYRQQRSLLSQFEFSAWRAQNESCLAHAWSGALAHLASRCTTARWHHWHNAPELVLEFRMRSAIPAQEGDCCGATTGLVDLRHVGSRDRSRQNCSVKAAGRDEWLPLKPQAR